MSSSNGDLDISPRDVVIMKVRVEYPTVSTRELSDILEEEYGIELIPTVIVERDGEEVARFVESEDRPIAEYLAAQLSE